MFIAGSIKVPKETLLQVFGFPEGKRQLLRSSLGLLVLSIGGRSMVKMHEMMYANRKRKGDWALETSRHGIRLFMPRSFGTFTRRRTLSGFVGFMHNILGMDRFGSGIHKKWDSMLIKKLLSIRMRCWPGALETISLLSGTHGFRKKGFTRHMTGSGRC